MHDMSYSVFLHSQCHMYGAADERAMLDDHIYLWNECMVWQVPQEPGKENTRSKPNRQITQGREFSYDCKSDLTRIPKLARSCWVVERILSNL